MRKNKRNKIIKNIITPVNLEDKIEINKNDTFYVFSEEFVKSINDITEEENKLALKLLSFLNISLEDDEDILITGNSNDLYKILVSFQRTIKSSLITV